MIGIIKIKDYIFIVLSCSFKDNNGTITIRSISEEGAKFINDSYNNLYTNKARDEYYNVDLLSMDGSRTKFYSLYIKGFKDEKISKFGYHYYDEPFYDELTKEEINMFNSLDLINKFNL